MLKVIHHYYMQPSYGTLQLLASSATSGADVSLSDKNNLTPLMYAAIHGYDSIARDLLASGRICVDCQDRH
ncbi:hypothetical protein BDV06DRAFT_192023 [Aspergillus oleicola]